MQLWLLAETGDDIVLWACAVIMLLVGLGLLASWFFALKRKRLMQDVPTSQVKGVFIGLNEVKGVARTAGPLVGFLSDERCIWYAYTVEEEWERTEISTDEDGNTTTEIRSGWETVDHGEERVIFEVEDDTGRIRVVPQKAEFIGDLEVNQTATRGDHLYYAKGPMSAIMDSTGRRRFREHVVKVDDSVYVLGSARLREDVVAPEIAYDPLDRTFLISSKSEEALTRRYGWISLFSIVGGWPMFTFFPAVLAWAIAGGDTQAEVNPWFLLLAFLGYGTCALALYLTLIYNGLVSVMQRVQRSWSLIEVQLQRRFDLIPRLVDVTKGYAAHETGTQESVALTRATSSSVMPSGEHVAGHAAATNAQTKQLGGLIALAESYPELRANDLFQKLSDEVIDTEDRISLARGYYNDSVTAYNDRIQKLPDVLFAVMFRYRSAGLYEIHAFERQAVRVQLDDEGGGGGNYG